MFDLNKRTRIGELARGTFRVSNCINKRVMGEERMK